MLSGLILQNAVLLFKFGSELIMFPLKKSQNKGSFAVEKEDPVEFLDS